MTGFPASEIRHGDRRAMLVPYKRDRDDTGKLIKSGHHAKRYSVGMLLAVKEFVPGPTAFNVRLVYVHGPNGDGGLSGASFTLGQVTRQIARELGHVRLDVFWRHWVINQDQDWYVRNLIDGTVSDDEIARRFQSRWSEKPAWLLRFEIETESAPRLLAAAGGSNSVRPGPDRRWVYAPRDTDREEDRGYTASDSRSLEGELPALSDAQWEAHVGPRSPFRIAQRLNVKRAEPWQARYDEARAEARARGRDVRSECRRFDLLLAEGKMEKAMRQLELIEARAFPAAA